MPQLVIFTLVGAAAIAGYKLVRREMARVERTMANLRQQQTPPQPQTLVRGQDGIFRPADRDG